MGLLGVSLAGCPKKYDSGADAAPAPAPADTATPAAPEPDTTPAAPEADTAEAPAPSDTAEAPAPADTAEAAAPSQDASEPAPEGDASEPAPEGDASAAADEPSPNWVVVSGGQGGRPSAITLSSQGGGAPELTRWLEPLVREAMNDDMDPSAAFVTAAKDAKTRPPALAAGATAHVLTAAGVEARKIAGFEASELGGAMRIRLPLDGEPLANWSLGAVGEPAPPKGARFVPLAGKPASDAVLEKVWSQFVAMMPDAKDAAIGELPPPSVTVYPAALGKGRTMLVNVCVPEPDMGEEACSLQGFAMADAAGTIKGWIRTVTSSVELKAPTIDGVVCDATFGTTEPYGVLYSGDDVALFTGLFAIGDEIYDLIHIEDAGVRAERLFEMIVE